MKALRRILSITVLTVVLMMTRNSGLATERTVIPSFHRVLVVNDTARPVVAEVQSGLITAVIEMQQDDGRWSAIGKLRAPAGAYANTELSEGEVWQFVIPDFGTSIPVIVRLAVGISGLTIYSQPFAAHVDPLAADVRVDCWLARIRPVHADQGPVIAAVESKPGS